MRTNVMKLASKRDYHSILINEQPVDNCTLYKRQRQLVTVSSFEKIKSDSIVRIFVRRKYCKMCARLLICMIMVILVAVKQTNAVSYDPLKIYCFK